MERCGTLVIVVNFVKNNRNSQAVLLRETQVNLSKAEGMVEKFKKENSAIVDTLTAYWQEDKIFIH